MSKKLFDLKKKLRKDKKGFTLVELIVVLVILAILIALLVPTLTGYIDNANKKKVLAEGRQVVMAAKTVAAEDYNSDEATKNLCGQTITDLTKTAAGTTEPTIEKLAEVAKSKYKTVSITFDDDGKVTSCSYVGKSYTATYDGSTGAWTTTKTPSDD